MLKIFRANTKLTGFVLFNELRSQLQPLNTDLIFTTALHGLNENVIQAKEQRIKHAKMWFV